MTMRLVIPLVLTFLLSSTFASLNAQTLAPPRNDVEGQLRAYGTRVRLFESVVLKRLDEIKPKGKQALDRQKQQDQELVIAKAEKVLKGAKSTAEIAEIAIKEYEQGTYTQDLETIEGEIALAKSDVARATDGLELMKRMESHQPQDLLLRPGGVGSADLQLKRARFSLEQAQTKRDVLVKYTKPKRMKELQDNWEKAKSRAYELKTDLFLAKDKLDQTHREIASAPKLTEAEIKALTQLDAALQVWQKIVVQLATFKGDIQAKREAFGPRIVELESALETAEQSWDDATELRLEVQDAEVRSRIRELLGMKTPG